MWDLKLHTLIKGDWKPCNWLKKQDKMLEKIFIVIVITCFMPNSCFGHLLVVLWLMSSMCVPQGNEPAVTD